ncbi:hypothetical protein HanPI659440_Chr17g0688491 [Helianthus annuus]|nr:hypothetical protein HanPI659440_Chr17g0688491 [Helianthus annuus]
MTQQRFSISTGRRRRRYCASPTPPKGRRLNLLLTGFSNRRTFTETVADGPSGRRRRHAQISVIVLFCLSYFESPNCLKTY